MRNWPFLLIAAVIFGACAHGRHRDAGEKIEPVEAEGSTAEDAFHEAASLRRAVEDAERKALRKVAGLFIAAAPGSAADQAARRLEDDVERYIDRAEIVEERRANGYLHERVRAYVLYQEVGRELFRRGLMRPATLSSRNVEMLVRVDGLSGLAQARDVIDDLRQNPEVVSASLASYGGSSAEFRIVTDNVVSDELAARLRLGRRIRLDVRSVQPREIRLTIL